MEKKAIFGVDFSLISGLKMNGQHMQWHLFTLKLNALNSSSLVYLIVCSINAIAFVVIRSAKLNFSRKLLQEVAIIIIFWMQ